VLQPDGKIIVLGSVAGPYSESYDFALARYDRLEGSTTFGNGGTLKRRHFPGVFTTVRGPCCRARSYGRIVVAEVIRREKKKKKRPGGGGGGGGGGRGGGRGGGWGGGGAGRKSVTVEFCTIAYDQNGVSIQVSNVWHDSL